MSGLAKTSELESIPEETHWTDPEASEPATDDVPTVISNKKISPASPAEILQGALKGYRLAHFELIAPVGVGGMAAVIKARDLQLDRLVALKILPPETSTDPDSVQRFRYEARAAARLDHENIARVFYYGEDRGLHFIAFEFVEGQDLRSMLEKRGRLPVAEALHYLLQSATGLAHAASRGVVHRDIKPSNIIVTPHGRAKLVDMGLARSLTPQDDLGLTQSGVTLGTFDYVSPEQALEPREADHRSDIYSMGCTFYHLLTGQTPVPEGTAAKKLHHHQHVPPIDPRELNPNIPVEVAWILARMMAKDPRDRYQRPEHLVHDLLEITHRLEGLEDQNDNVYYLDIPVAPSTPMKPLVLGAIALVMVVALVFTMGRSSGDSGPSFFSPKTAEAPIRVGSDPWAKKMNAQEQEQPVNPDVGDHSITYRITKTGTQGLLARLRDKSRPFPANAHVTIELADNLDLRDLEQVSIRAKSIRIIASEMRNGEKPVLKIGVGPTKGIALHLQADRVEIQGIRIVQEVPAETAEQRDVVGISIDGGDQHRIRDCELIQVCSRLPKKPISSLEFVGQQSSSKNREATLENCVFLGGAGLSSTSQLTGARRGGDVAVRRRTSIKLLIRECAFGPHRQVFRLEDSGGSEADVVLDRSTLMMGDSSCVWYLVQSETFYYLQAKQCLIARLRSPDASPNAGTEAVLIAQEGSEPPVPPFELRVDDCNGNVLCQLDQFWGTQKTWKDYQSLTRNGSSATDPPAFLHLDVLPWKSKDPAQALASLNFADAFRPDDQMEVLHRLNQSDRLVGLTGMGDVEYKVGVGLVNEKPIPPTAKRLEKIIDPSPGSSGANQFRTIAGALAETQSEKEVVLLLRHDGELTLGPIPLRLTQGRTITIRPEAGSRPKIIFEAEKNDTALFELRNGALKLENLHIELRAGQNSNPQSLISFRGESSCDLSQCLVTLRSPEGGTLSLASMEEYSRTGMGMDSRGPQLRLNECFVRGEGDLLRNNHRQSFELQVRRSLTVLTGSLLWVQEDVGVPLRMDMERKGADQGEIRLENVTALVRQHLCHVFVRDLKTMRHLHWDVKRCLFASSGKTPMIKLEGPRKIDELMLKMAFQWTGEKNVYSNFTSLLARQREGDGPPAEAPLGLQNWKDLMKEDESSTNQIGFEKEPDSESFSGASPEDFETNLQEGVGAPLSTLPKPLPKRGMPAMPIPE